MPFLEGSLVSPMEFKEYGFNQFNSIVVKIVYAMQNSYTSKAAVLYLSPFLINGTDHTDGPIFRYYFSHSKGLIITN